MKLYEAEQSLVRDLKEMYDDGEAAHIAGLVMEHLTHFSKTERIMKKEVDLTGNQLSDWERYAAQLKNKQPVQYLMNKAWFYGLELYVDNNVLIPRPETEELVDWIINDVNLSGKDVFEKKENEADETTELKILDVGTGSGCIALALKKTLARAEVWGCDISEAALNVARRNGSALDIRVDFQGLDFLDEAQQRQLPTVHILVSNPPYVPLKDKDQMHANVVNYEPHTALFVPDHDPLLFYKALAQFGKKRLYAGGSIYMEIHEDLGQEVMDLFRKQGYGVELKKDLQQKNRMVKAVT
jgi:release factor glutamine methyltransferase